MKSHQVALLIVLTSLTLVKISARKVRPNLILVISDDVGYGDFHHTGHPTQEPNEIDQMVKEGMRFTHFMAAGRMCSPNRAALLTGRYPVRMGIHGHSPIFLPQLSSGLPANEVTLAESLKDFGYKTGIVGKWHLGINQHNNTDGAHLPKNHGFEYVGLNLPLGHLSACNTNGEVPFSLMKQMCFLFNGSTIIEQPYNTDTLSPRMVDDAKHFIRRHKNDPFFLYFSLPQPHDPAFCSERFCGKSKRGRVGDVVNEMAWSVGEVMAEVKRNSLERNTLVFYINDHGPSQFGCQEHFSKGGLRGTGASCWEGDIRVPAVAWWPGKIPKLSISSAIVSSLDIFPTFLKLAGGKSFARKLMEERGMDGKIIPLFPREQSAVQDRFLVHYCNHHVFAARFNEFKLHFKTLNNEIDNTVHFPINCTDVSEILSKTSCEGESVKHHDPPILYNIDHDPTESFPLLLSDHEEVVQNIMRRLEEHKYSFTITNPGLLDAQYNPALAPCCDPPRCTCNYNS